jgi:hypothetical protein
MCVCVRACVRARIHVCGIRSLVYASCTITDQPQLRAAQSEGGITKAVSQAGTEMRKINIHTPLAERRRHNGIWF